MSTSAHTRRADTGFTTAQLGLYLYLAANAMFHGALYSSYALLRTAAETWTRGQQLPIAALGGLALLALLASAIAPRVGATPGRNAAITSLVSVLFLSLLSVTLVYLGAPPAASTYFALVHLFALVAALHALAGGVAALFHDPGEPQRRLLSTFNAATALFWGVALGLALLV